MNAAAQVLGPALADGRGGTTAVICEDRSLTFSELDALSNRFGNAMKAAGVGRQDRVLFLLKDTPELVAGYLGALKIGAVALALSIRSTADELLFALNDSGARLLIVDAEFADLYDGIAGGLSDPPTVVAAAGPAKGAFTTLAAWLDGRSPALEPEPMGAEDMAYWLYTSGTTGRPKAVVHLHRDARVADLHLRHNLGVGPGDRIFVTSKLFFAYAVAHSLLGGLKCGASLVLHPGWPDAQSVAEVIERTRPDLVFSVPTLYRKLLLDGFAAAEAFRSVRHFVSAGESLPGQLFRRWREATGVPILQGIGTTETTFLFIANTADAHRADSCGRVLPWAEARLTDERGGRITRPDTPGALWVRMDSLFEGYWNQPEKTGDVMDGSWYRTDDVFTFDAEGWWYFRGRNDDMIKVSGQWVNPADIEEAVLSVPGIADAAVVGVSGGDGLVRMTLFAVPGSPAAGTAALADLLRDTLGGKLPRYKCPRDIRVIDEIPRTASGKIQRFKLRQLAE